jgi:hypothetical protein
MDISLYYFFDKQKFINESTSGNVKDLEELQAFNNIKTSKKDQVEFHFRNNKIK